MTTGKTDPAKAYAESKYPIVMAPTDEAYLMGSTEIDIGKRMAAEEGYRAGAASREAEIEEAFRAGHEAKIRQEYNSAIMRNGFGNAAGRYITVEEAFTDYQNRKGRGDE